MGRWSSLVISDMSTHNSSSAAQNCDLRSTSSNTVMLTSLLGDRTRYGSVCIGLQTIPFRYCKVKHYVNNDGSFITGHDTDFSRNDWILCFNGNTRSRLTMHVDWSGSRVAKGERCSIFFCTFSFCSSRKCAVKLKTETHDIIRIRLSL